jgi:hypothetical protein
LRTCCRRFLQVLRPPAPPCQELQEEEVRPHRTAAPQEEVEVNYGLSVLAACPLYQHPLLAAAAVGGGCWLSARFV